jgi:hypothetical protein
MMRVRFARTLRAIADRIAPDCRVLSRIETLEERFRAQDAREAVKREIMKRFRAPPSSAGREPPHGR